MYAKYFQISDISSALAWLIFFTVVVAFQSAQFDRNTALIYRRNFYFKVLFSLLFSIFYLVIVQGGDTTAYWDGAKCIQNLLLEDTAKGIEHLFTTPDRANYTQFFDAKTGFPPGWIYREPESYFVTKITSILGLFAFKSYFATTFIFVYLFARANWKLYEVAKMSGLFKSKYLPYAILLVPSTAFWCSGITKDTLIIISFFNIFYHFYFMFVQGESRSVKRWFLVILYAAIIYNLRSFFVIAVVLPLLAAGMKQLYKKMNLDPIFRVPVNLLLITLFMGGAVAFMASNQGTTLIMNNSAMQEALTVQHDFANNKTYGKNKYSLGTIDNSPFGILKAMPFSIFAGVFEPLPWKGLTASLFLNAMESALMLFLVIQLIVSGKFVRWVQTINQHEILVFCFVFVLLMAFIAGFTSMLYGVLVRFRAPLLPLWFALLIIDIAPKQIESEENLKKAID